MRAVLANAVAVVFGTAVLGLSTTAKAGVSIGIDIHSGPPVRQAWVGPVYETRIERVWIPPITQAVTQNVWHPAETRDQIARTWLPDRYEDRDIAERDQYGRTVITRRKVLVEPGHWQDANTPVEVRPGYWAMETQIVTVSPGRWETTAREVCVRPGYYADCGPVYAAPPMYYGHYESRFDGRYDRRGGYDRGDRFRDRR